MLTPLEREAIALAADLAGYVLPGEECPERCSCGSEDGEHDPGNDDLYDALTLFVKRAREVAR